MASSTYARVPAWSRRRFLSTLGVGSALLLAGRGGAIRAATGVREYPFTLGVASGEPSSDGFVIWTRLAQDPFVDVSAYPHAVNVDWEIAEDERMTRIVRRGSALADPEWAHSVHVDVEGLRADRWYWYRFHCDGEASPIGRSRTLPAIGAPMQRLRLAVASCQHFEHGYFSAYRHMLDDDLDLIVHVGDYIYEGSWGTRLREHESARGAVTLADYRNRHACYKRDPDLQAAHAAYPWLLTWDDHEVSNDYAGSDLHDTDPNSRHAAPLPTAPISNTCRCAHGAARPPTHCRCTVARRSATSPRSTTASTRVSTACAKPAPSRAT